MITLNDQDLEALLKVSDKELVKLAVAPTAAMVRGREKAGRSTRIALHQIPHSDSGNPRS
jgi:hypothetical protein